MTRRLLMALGLGLSLGACDKPAVADGSNPAESSRSLPRQRSLPESARTHGPPLHQRLATALNSSENRQQDLAALAWDALETDPETAHKAFHHLATDSPEKLLLIQHYAMRLATDDPDAAIAWARSFPSETETSAAVGHVAIALAEADPVRAASLLSEFGIAGRQLDVALVQVVQRWATTSPPDAAAWVAQFPEGPARTTGLQAIVDRWLTTDPATAFRWATSLQDPTLRAEAVDRIESIVSSLPDAVQTDWRTLSTAP